MVSFLVGRGLLAYWIGGPPLEFTSRLQADSELRRLTVHVDVTAATTKYTTHALRTNIRVDLDLWRERRP